MQEQKKKKIRSRDITHRMIVMNQMHRRMLECNLEGTGIHRAQHRLLMTLAKHSFASQVELAKFLEISPATVAVALKALKKSEYITQKMREEDNRRNFVELTEKGRKLVEESCDFFDMLDEQMYVGFSESEKEQVCDYFDRIYENMERLKIAAMEGQNETV